MRSFVLSSVQDRQNLHLIRFDPVDRQVVGVKHQFFRSEYTTCAAQTLGFQHFQLVAQFNNKSLCAKRVVSGDELSDPVEPFQSAVRPNQITHRIWPSQLGLALVRRNLRCQLLKSPIRCL